MKIFSFIVFVLCNSVFGQQNVSEKCLIQINLDSVMIDTSLNEDIRSFFEDDDGKTPLKSFKIDLNEDGNFEKIIPNEYLCGLGGCPWIIYNTKFKRVEGRVNAKMICIINKKSNAYYQIETLWRIEGSEFIIKKYAFKGHEYKETLKSVLNKQQLSEYIKKM